MAQLTHILRRPGLGLPGTRTLFLAAVILLALPTTTRPIDDPDFFWHLEIGKWILRHRAFIYQDLFTYTVPGHPFVDAEWLSEVVMAALVNLIGWGGVALFFGLLTWLGFGVLLRSIEGTGFLLAGFSLALGVAAGKPIWGPRAQMVTFAFTVVMLFVLRRYRRSHDRRWLYSLPPLFGVWVNAHGGFVFGLGLLTLFAAGERLAPATDRPPLKPVIGIGLLCFLATLLNPYLIGIYGLVLATLTGLTVREFAEWKSPDFHDPQLWPFGLMVLLLVTVLAASRRPPRASDLMLLVVTLGLALVSVRNVVLFVAVATPVLAEQAQTVYEASRTRFKDLPAIELSRAAKLTSVVLLVGLAMVDAVLLGPALHSNPHSPRVTARFPVVAIDSLSPDLPPGRVFNEGGWGGYLVYRLWPERRVFIYNAAPVADPVLSQYIAIADVGPGYDRRLDAWQVNWVVIQTGTALDITLEHSPQWSLVYQDQLASVLVRRTPATADYLARHNRK